MRSTNSLTESDTAAGHAYFNKSTTAKYGSSRENGRVFASRSGSQALIAFPWKPPPLAPRRELL